MKESTYKDLLAQWLPEHWRTRDVDHSLSKLLSAYGELLDAFHATVMQRLHDSFPNRDDKGQCQDWLLPYFAQLLDVRLVSPDADGRRDEVTHAVAWRQRKGTRRSIEKIAEAVGQFEVEIQEGWTRIAMTPRIERSLLHATVYGEDAIDSPATPSMHALHPGLPAATLDVRHCSRAVQCTTQGARMTNFGGTAILWRQIHRHGVPCVADSYQDASRRTVDVRTPTLDGRRGFCHPRRVLLFVPPPDGFFPRKRKEVVWSELARKIKATPLGNSDSGRNITIEVEAAVREWDAKSKTYNLSNSSQKVSVRIIGDVDRLSLCSLSSEPLYLIENDAVTLVDHLDLQNAKTIRLENFWIENLKLEEAAIDAVELAGCAIMKISTKFSVPVIDAKNCLLNEVESANGVVRLEHVTILRKLKAKRLEASDSILPDFDANDWPQNGCIRYSRIPPLPKERQNDCLFANNCTAAQTLFRTKDFGTPSCGVLHPECPKNIQSGAEDGGEMGAFHSRRHVLRRLAVLEKLHEFLPVGIEAVMMDDPSLTCVPPKPKELS